MFSLPLRAFHYYGDNVRRIFLVCAGVMMVAIPLAPSILPVSPIVAVAFILLVGVMAGLTNPKQLWVIQADTLLAAVGFVVFEYGAMVGAGEAGVTSLTFAGRQLLAVCFFFALYFSAKTWRAGTLRATEEKDPV